METIGIHFHRKTHSYSIRCATDLKVAQMGLDMEEHTIIVWMSKAW